MTSKLISFVLSEAPKLRSGSPLESKPVQSAPQYYESSMPKQFEIGSETIEVMGRQIKFSIRGYRPDILMIEAIADVADLFSNDTFKLRDALVDACHKISKNRGGKFDLSEEYSLAVLSGYTGEPEDILKKHSAEIVKFLKSEELPLDEKEIEYTLATQLKYAKNDLIVVDWDGALILEPTDQIEAIVDLFQLTNLDLLRYRMLDFDLDTRLSKANRLIQKKPRTFFSQKETAQAFKDIIMFQSQSIAEFNALEREIKLIGDWYSARLYDLISKKFKLEDWKKSVQEKLASLEDLYTIIAENFSMSKNERLELIQIVLFFILQVGWFVLIILELFYYLPKR